MNGGEALGQVTIYLDDENEKRLKAAAKAAGMPVSRWVASLVEERASTVWPESVRRLAGAWRDFPDLESIRKTEGKEPSCALLGLESNRKAKGP